MRDPSRIPEILNALRVVWEARPDLRLGQLITIVAEKPYAPVFYIEDDTVLRRLKDFTEAKL